MPDLYLDWNQDLILTPGGSAATCDGWDRVRQRIVRNFLTNSATPLPDGTITPPDYVFSPFYGLGAGALIDQNPDDNYRLDLTRRMRQAALLDTSVDPGAVPTVQIIEPQIGTNVVSVTVKLTNGDTGTVNILLGSPGS